MKWQRDNVQRHFLIWNSTWSYKVRHSNEKMFLPSPVQITPWYLAPWIIFVSFTDTLRYWSMRFLPLKALESCQKSLQKSFSVPFTQKQPHLEFFHTFVTFITFIFTFTFEIWTKNPKLMAIYCQRWVKQTLRHFLHSSRGAHKLKTVSRFWIISWINRALRVRVKEINSETCESTYTCQFNQVTRRPTEKE